MMINWGHALGGVFALIAIIVAVAEIDDGAWALGLALAGPLLIMAAVCVRAGRRRTPPSA